MSENEVKKICYTGTSLDDIYLNISDGEVIDLHQKMMNAYHNFLEVYKVRKPRKNELDYSKPPRELIEEFTAKDFWLVFLFKYPMQLVAKDMITAFVQKYRPYVSGDQQIRHLKEDGWDLLTQRSNYHDVNGNVCVVPSGYYYLRSMDMPSPKFQMQWQRKNALTLSKGDWVKIKSAYAYKCAVCGIKEGTFDVRKNNAKVVLQKGHMDPAKGADETNIIPMCSYCNQYYKDNFIFNEYGRVYAVNDAKVIDRSPLSVQREIYNRLKKKIDEGKL